MLYPSTVRRTTPEIEEALGKAASGAQPSESFIDQPYSTEIYAYLRGTPKEFNYVLTPAARKDILHKVSWFLLSKDNRLAELVPLDERTGGAPREELQDEVEVPIEYTEVRRGQPCGHVFKRGEGVYRCKNCSMDDTCVLCTRCFQATDHTGHDTSFSMNSGTGGCCDCGDPEAWRIPLRCRHHSSFEQLDEVGLEPIISSAGAPFVPGYNNNECPASVKHSIELTIAVVLEFILETFSTSPVNLNMQFDENAILEDAKNASMAINDSEPQTKFSVVLWNDEVHSFQDVIDQCMEALQCSHMEAKRIAETVDSSGRDVLRVSTSIADLIDIATTMTNVSLSVSIRAARDIFREQLSASLLIWLRDLACCKFRPLARVFQGKINNEICAEICHQLCLRWVAPYRNAHLADLLERLYEFSLDDGDDGSMDDDEDDAEANESESDDVVYHNKSSCSSAEAPQQYANERSSACGYQHTLKQLQMKQQPETDDQTHASENTATDTPVDAENDGAIPRNRRRRRSMSDDDLLQQGDERASPRSFSLSGNRLGIGSQNDDIPASLWLSETASPGNRGMVPATIHAAMGAAADAVDVARTSIARIIQPNIPSGYPQHSAAPGAFPHTSALAEAGEPEDVGQDQPSLAAIQDPDADSDYETNRSIDRVLRGCGQQRLDWFLVFDLQLWKEVRSGLRELYMATLMLDGRYKMKIALTFARNYPRLSRAFLMQDRAPEHSVLLFSVQLFTAPTLSASLVDHHQFMYIILDVLKKFFIQPTPMILRHCGVILCDTESFRNRRYFHVFHDMRYLAGTPQVRNWVSSRHSFLSTYLGFIGLFQGMNPNRRATLQHVEFEADTWVNAFNVTLQVAKSCRQFAECYGISARDLFFSMRGTLRKLQRTVSMMAEENCSFIVRNAQIHGYLPSSIGNAANLSNDTSDTVHLGPAMHSLSTLWGKQYEIVQFDVSTSPVSFHHPLHWFMAELCQHVKHLANSRARDYGFATLRDMVFSAFDIRLDTTLEPPTDGSKPTESEQGGLPNASKSISPQNLYSIDPESAVQAQRELLRILDYPVRVCVVMAQIRAGMWVRNGYVIRSQAHHYREVSLRENTYDQDIVLIQFFISIWQDTDHILMTLLDRFGLYDWFSGRPHASRIYDPLQTQYMVEEFLNLLIVLVSERHVATGKNTLDLSRREIVHGCLSPISYSELTKKIPERLAEHTEFDTLLQQMANYRGPVSVTDFGKYELKDEYLDEVDPYFIHYSRNQREEIEELLRERLRKRTRTSGEDTDDVAFYIPPKLEPIRFGPFQRIGMLLHTPLACQMLFYALLHATHTSAELMSETIVDEALQLIVLALEDGKRGALAQEIGGPDADGSGVSQTVNRGGLWKYALEQGYPSARGAPMNLLGLVLTLGLKPEMKQWMSKLNYIYNLFREGGPRIVGCIDDYYANLEATPMGSRVLKSAMEEARAAERKKQAAKSRQAAILADFANRQQNFLMQYGEEFEDLSDDDNNESDLSGNLETEPENVTNSSSQRMHQTLWNAPTGACIVCQEDCETTKPYGILALVQANRAVRDAPLVDASHVVDILQLPDSLDSESAGPNTSESSSPDDLSLLSATKGTSQTRSAAHVLSAINQIAAGAYGAPSGLKGFPVLYHQRGMVASTCSHLMHVGCFIQYCQGVEAKRQQQPTRNHPENPHRKEFLCPLCKSLGNVLLPTHPNAANFDPLVAADRDPDRFAQPNADDPDASLSRFEQWLQDDWKPFVHELTSASGGQTSGRVSSETANDKNTTGASTTSREKAPAIDVSNRDEAQQSARQASNAAGDTATALRTRDSEANTSALTAAATGGVSTLLQNTGGLPFNIADSLTESMPRLDDLFRGTQRLPGGFGLHALLSRFLPQIASGALGVAPGSERMAYPLSRCIRWRVEYHSSEDDVAGRHQQKPQQSQQGRTNPNTSHELGSVSYSQAVAENMTSTQEAVFREQMEAYQYMYTRLYEVLQNVQRDNHVGLPSSFLFEHLLRRKDKNSNAATPMHHRQTVGHALPAQHTQQEVGPDSEKDDSCEFDYESASDSDEMDEDGRHNQGEKASMSASASSISGTGALTEQTLSALPPFLRTIVDQLRVLSAGGGGGGGGQFAALPSLADGSGTSGQPQDSKTRPYPFDKAANALFIYTVESLELAQRGIRNPPVFNHEDSRKRPSGTIADGVSEAHALFLHSLGKTSELQYRTVLGPLFDISKPHVESSDPSIPSVPPVQRLRALVAESHAPTIAASTHGDVLSRTRLDMLKDIGFMLAPLGGQHTPRLREIASEQARWQSGTDAVPPKPFLLRNIFSDFAELSISLVMPLGLDIWHITRLCIAAELLRICVAVGDSLLGEYTGAPKALRIAQHVPVDGTTHAHSTTAAGKTANDIPQPWVDAPEVRDANLVSQLTKGSDASFLEASAKSIQSLVVWAISRLQGPDRNEEAIKRLESAAHPITVTKLVAVLLLPFLRKVALVFNVQYGIDLAREAPWLQADRARATAEGSTNSQVLSQSEPECVRLLRLLNLPTLHHIFVPESQPAMASLADGWLRELRLFRRRHGSSLSLGAGHTMAVPVNMPTLFSLVELPDRFEDLFERSAKAFCPRCNGVPSDPALCLLCGTFICAQSFCCEEDGIGECNMHMKTCGGSVGMYLLVKKCGLLLLHHDNGCFMSAPYLDQHGEVDLGLKRGRPLFINRVRYEEMRKLVLAQKIPIYVAHKIDQAFDIGGWVSL
ncbi:E3 ubiquitin-protein ligase ubr1 [Coemansia sp. RSA 1646]|nr:E3 ubiquitin-protein ligase ubr1 [Coemansia sp. RSA 1646]KAJ1770031.1 E3 ubiquitin-protein ligase ubr1 [Coemansia sp. RSA 1843]KAJ2211514.1 E3 ubiquitin-protein ligase ubr1 [Coemansia sp. RSA 487]